MRMMHIRIKKKIVRFSHNPPEKSHQNQEQTIKLKELELEEAKKEAMEKKEMKEKLESKMLESQSKVQQLQDLKLKAKSLNEENERLQKILDEKTPQIAQKIRDKNDELLKVASEVEKIDSQISYINLDTKRKRIETLKLIAAKLKEAQQA